MVAPDAAPPPWHLEGSAFLAVFLGGQDAADDRFLDPRLERSGDDPLSLMIFVDYKVSPVGPYYELLYSPGSVTFPDGSTGRTVSRVLVSTEPSVRAGRHNWGIPKELARFEVVDEDGVRRVSLGPPDGPPKVEVAFRGAGPTIPITSAIVPRGVRTVSHLRGGRVLRTTVSGHGSMRTGRMLVFDSDPGWFPALGDRRVLVAAEIPHFEITFPHARETSLALGMSPIIA